MIVNSIIFWLFFTCVLVVYYGFCRKSSRWQNVALLFASYVFYGLVDWGMCLLFLGATIAFYCLGIAIHINIKSNPKHASFLTTLGVCLGAGLLVYFKYLNFFMDQFCIVLELMGLNTNWNSFNIIMPLGISFFTFKLIAYVIEVHRGNMPSSKDPVAFGVNVAFFPTIMSGPIDNPTKFMPQLERARMVDLSDVGEAFKRIIWGLFLKKCIADQISGYTTNFIRIAEDFSLHHKVAFYNYNDDARFTCHTEFFNDQVHMNKIGAELFSQDLANKIMCLLKR